MKRLVIYTTLGFICLYVLIFVTGCSQFIDFRQKSIATEQKVCGLDATIPSLTVGNSLLSIKFGWISTRYISAPDGGKAEIKNEYKDINIWSLSGSGTSNLMVSTDTQKASN